MDPGWLKVLAGGVGGGSAVKILDVIYQEYRRRSEVKESAKDLIDKHLDAILKAADELVGKIRSLAQSDFKEVIKAPIPKDSEFDSWTPYMDLLYLFAQFWSRIQILRIESLFVNLGTDIRGKRLLNFFRALESTRSRLVPRGWQRGMGEVLLEHKTDGFRILTYVEFVHRFLSKDEIRKWFQPLVSALARMNHTYERQRLLAYGVIVHALIDTLDTNHLVTKDRPGWPNKLTTRTKRSLKYRVFGLYLPFVKNPQIYYAVGSTKRKPKPH